MSQIHSLQPSLTSVRSKRKLVGRCKCCASGEEDRLQNHSTEFLIDKNAVCLLHSPSLENFLQIQAMRQLQILQLL